VIPLMVKRRSGCLVFLKKSSNHPKGIRSSTLRRVNQDAACGVNQVMVTSVAAANQFSTPQQIVAFGAKTWRPQYRSD